MTRRHQKIKRILVEEAGGACVICGYARTVLNLHFHHVDPNTKCFAVNMARGKSLAAFREEAKKCVLLCANCHGEVEAGLIDSPPTGTRWGQWPPVPASFTDEEWARGDNPSVRSWHGEGAAQGVRAQAVV